jgi:hypothetical protein
MATDRGSGAECGLLACCARGHGRRGLVGLWRRGAWWGGGGGGGRHHELEGKIVEGVGSLEGDRGGFLCAGVWE